MSLFQLSDMYYSRKKGLFEGYNPKGLLHVRHDRSAAYRKPAYFAAQHVFSLFDDRFPLRPLEPIAVEASFRTEAYAWSLCGANRPAVMAWWRADDTPALTTPPLETVGLAKQTFDNPVLMDFISGSVFALPSVADDDRFWSALPCTDVPLAIAERDVLAMWQAESEA